jgi:hypothetical protein
MVGVTVTVAVDKTGFVEVGDGWVDVAVVSIHSVGVTVDVFSGTIAGATDLVKAAEGEGRGTMIVEVSALEQAARNNPNIKKTMIQARRFIFFTRFIGNKISHFQKANRMFNYKLEGYYSATLVLRKCRVPVGAIPCGCPVPGTP